MDAVQVFAILFSGLFVGILVTAIFYIFSVRQRLLEPVSLESVGLLDETLRVELAEQRAIVEQLNAALTHHTRQLEANTQAVSGEGIAALHEMLRTQTEAATTLTGLLSGQEATLRQTTRQIETISGAALPGITSQLQTQTEKLLSISTKLDEWAATRADDDAKLAKHASILAELDRQMAAQAETVQQLDSRVSEHTTMLVTAATERREQGGVLQRVAAQIGQLFPLISQIVTHPPRPGQDRLTDIKGIGPVYAGKLYEAGIHTYKQLAAMTTEEIYTLIGAPKWRAKSFDPAYWIEQAEHLASQREKVEDVE